MLHKLTILVGPALVVMALAFAPTASFAAEAATFKIGDTVFVNVDKAEFKLGDTVLRQLDKGTPLKVTELQNDWVGGDILLKGAIRRGWVKANKLTAVMPASKKAAPKPVTTDSGTKSPAKPIVAAKPDAAKPDVAVAKQTTGEKKKAPKGSLAAKFDRILAEKERAEKTDAKATKPTPEKASDQTVEKPAKVASAKPIEKPAPPAAAPKPTAPVKKQAAPTKPVPAKPAQASGAKTPAPKDVNTDVGKTETKQPAKVAMSPPKQEPAAEPTPAPKKTKTVPAPTAAAKLVDSTPKVAKPIVKDQAASAKTVAPPKAVAKKEDVAKKAGDEAKTQKVTEGPESLADKFAKILAERRAAEGNKTGPKPSTAKTSAAKPVAKPRAPIAPPKKPVAPAATVASQPPAIDVLVVRIADNLVDVEPSKRIGQLILSGDQFTNRSLRPLRGLSVDTLSIEAVNVSNISLQYVKEMHGIRTLRLWSPGFDDGGLAAIGALTDLELLDIEGTMISGTQFAELKNLQKLKTVILGPEVTDAELAALTELPTLQRLDLRACHKLTLAAVEPLAKLAKIEVIWLPRHIRTKGKRALRSALPKCQVRS